MKLLARITVLAGIASLVGCSFQYVARDAETYRRDTRDLLSTKNSEIKACYDEQLKTTPNTSGKVVLKFDVQEETGMIVNAQIDQAESSAPDALKQCVLNAVEQLVLEPPDERKGVATFSWEFAVKS